MHQGAEGEHALGNIRPVQAIDTINPPHANLVREFRIQGLGQTSFSCRANVEIRVESFRAEGWGVSDLASFVGDEVAVIMEALITLLDQAREVLERQLATNLHGSGLWVEGFELFERQSAA